MKGHKIFAVLAVCLLAFRFVDAADKNELSLSTRTAVAISTSNEISLSSGSAATFTFPISSSPITVSSLIQNLSLIEGRTKTIFAHFDQVIKIKDAGLTQHVSGSLSYEKPQRFNIRQVLPEPQRVVSDGDNIWIWRPSKKQVLEMGLQDWGKSEPFAQGLLDFGHYSKMLKNYRVQIKRSVPLSGDLKGYRKIVLLLTPKNALKPFSLRLKLNTRDFFPYESEFKQEGVFVHSRFRDIVYNIALSSSEFHFDVPPDAQVFDERIGGR